MSRPNRRQSASPGIIFGFVGIILDEGQTVPADGVAGYESGGLFIDNNASAGAQLQTNTGTAASAAFKAVVYDGMTVAAQTITTLTTNAINMAAAASTITLKANTAAALGITDATTTLVTLDTRNTVTAVANVLVTPLPTTIAGASGTTHSAVKVGAYTLTDSTQTGVTAIDGLQLFLAAATIAQTGGAVTVTTASALYISKVVAGSSVTITNNYIVNTDQAGCFCTAAGVWTDTASWEEGKNFVQRATTQAVDKVYDLIDKLVPASWEYKKEIHGDDFGRERAGIIYDDLPDELRMPGDKKWVGTGPLVSFALAAIKLLRDENKTLKARLDALEAA